VKSVPPKHRKFVPPLLRRYLPGAGAGDAAECAADTTTREKGVEP
jgi:hypothetical protein